jgi:hypothetical protein
VHELPHVFALHVFVLSQLLAVAVHSLSQLSESSESLTVAVHALPQFKSQLHASQLQFPCAQASLDSQSHSSQSHELLTCAQPAVFPLID